MLNGRMVCASCASRAAQNATTADGQHGMRKKKTDNTILTKIVFWFQKFRALKCPAHIHPRLDTIGNCHRQHLASGALPQLEHLSVAALVMDNMK